MSFLRVLFYGLGFALLYSIAALAQPATNSDDLNASLRSCEIIRKVVEAQAQTVPASKIPADDDFNVAAKACDTLTAAISKSDQQQVQSAAAALRPILALLGRAPTTRQEQLAALEKQTSGATGVALFDKLPQLAKRAMKAGETDKAEAYAKQLLQMAPDYPNSWNYGNAIFYGNVVLGHVALQRGNLEQAGQYLLTAAGTPGSPGLDTSGPNMVLAKELLEKGQSDVVLQYFVLCKNFWKMDRGKLDEWSATVREGKVPRFSANLEY
jgi:hypothetical protein